MQEGDACTRRVLDKHLLNMGMDVHYDPPGLDEQPWFTNEEIRGWERL